jgi:hypothetical protein
MGSQFFEKMRCNLQTREKVIIIASISLLLTILSSLNLIDTIGAFLSGGTSPEIDLVFGGKVALALGIQIPIYVVWIVSEILCLVGAIKNTKYLLIPFMICEILTIMACIGLGILLITLGVKSGEYFIFLMIIPLLIVIGVTICWLRLVEHFYNDDRSSVDGFQIKNQTWQAHMDSRKENAQDVIYAYNPESATNIYPQKGYAYPANNSAVKSPV